MLYDEDNPEIDIPLIDSSHIDRDGLSDSPSFEILQVSSDNGRETADKNEKSITLKHARWTLVASLAFLGILYFLNFFCVSQSKEITDAILEVCKIFVFTLSGFLYGKKGE